MADLHLDNTAKTRPVVPPTPELDERVWLEWKAKHRANDRVRAARRKRVLALVFVAALVGLVVFRLTAGA